MNIKGLVGRSTVRGLVVAAAGLTVAADANAAKVNANPPAFVSGPVFVHRFPASNDLLTAGLGWDGIASGVAPAVSDPPTRIELRRLAIYTAMRGLLSTSATEGYGTVYATHGPAPGVEYMALAGGGSDGAAHTLLVQIPDQLNTDRPCIVTAPSSGSRGIYGAIANAEVAFENGCAVAYTDKGTGVGVHDLDRDVVYDIFGRTHEAGQLKRAHYRADRSIDLRRFKREFPSRIAFKHAYSGDNPEADWGRFLLQSIRFALWAMNDHRAPDTPRFTKENTRIIAAGVSNGGGAALLAAEQDREGLIDGVVVSEPQVQPRPTRRFVILDRGARFALHSRGLFAVTTFMNLYADCAGVDLNAVTPAPPGAVRCQALKDHGLLDAGTLPDQVQESLDRIHAFGLLPDADRLLPTHASLHLWRILAAVYGSAYARASVADHLCRMSFASTGADGSVVQWDEANMKRAFGSGNGLPSAALTPSGGGPFIIDDTLSPPKNELTEPDLNLDGALCWRALLGGNLPTARLPSGRQISVAAKSIASLRATGDLQGKPAIVMHGRKDALVAPNHSSRAYYGLNQTVEGSRSNARYIEVANGNHFDAFIPLYPALGAPGETLVAMHGWFNQAVRLMLRHVDGRGGLPQSQVFAATQEACPLPLVAEAENRIRFRPGRLIIPEGTPPAGC